MPTPPRREEPLNSSTKPFIVHATNAGENQVIVYIRDERIPITKRQAAILISELAQCLEK